MMQHCENPTMKEGAVKNSNAHNEQESRSLDGALLKGEHKRSASYGKSLQS